MWPFSKKRVVETRDQTFTDQRIELDGKLFVRCTFVRCILVYSGGDGGGISGCTINNCVWKLEGAAANTVGFMAAMYHSGESGRDLIEGTIKNIREIA
ncbi:MAG TPA: hypothetical protein VKB45_12565 [Gemmatimonadales bacterium]|nr:hypothetical protein [Gemmatimonadales bacterium]HKE91164.1 hypothetical protein [Gemmatimonadales bacterium]